ncbi:Thioredoxin domain-containing protein [Cephalotus follicularis]|uniref:Thioredoxin domain-containing protein n=1 Tax=Cephalotus follicularis TaxID=3775 RepID=A0A1Q3BXG0_CEPFO|nr:Thioredoxin domain-containing protein [Cephalotus follicularis]
MAMEKCIQVSTVGTARACVAKCYHPFSSKVKLPLQTSCKALKKPISLSSPNAYSFYSRCQKSRIICKASEAVDEVQVATESNWENLVIGNERPVLVEFWAPWCGPCRMIAPVIEELAKEYAGKVACYKVNTDDCPNTATKYGIRSIPTVLFFKNGEKKESVIGAVPKATLSTTIEKYLE